MNEPKRLIEESDSPLERALLSAGSYSRGGDQLRGKVLVALGVAAAVSTTSKSSLAMMASWKQAVVIGALGCVGVGGAVAYQQWAAPSPVAVSAATAGGGVGSADSHSRAVVKQAPPETGAAEAPAGAEGRDGVGAAGPAGAGPGGADPGELGAADLGVEAPAQVGSSAIGSSAIGSSAIGSSAIGSVAIGSPVGGRSSGIAARQAEGTRAEPEPRSARGRSGVATRSGTARGASNAGRGESGRGASSAVRGESGATAAARREGEQREARGVEYESSAPAAAPSALEQEVAILDSARSALADGRWGDALRHLRDHSTRFPRGSLRLEAEVLRIEALASSGATAEASRRAQAILNRSPNSIVAGRLRRFVLE